MSARTASGRERGRPPCSRRTLIPSSRGSNWGLSPSWPGVRMILIGIPLPSTARWILLLSPPRERPIPSPSTAMASRADSPFFPAPAACWWARTHGRIDTDDPLDLPDGIVLHDRLVQDLLPGAIQRPPPQPFVRGLPPPVPVRQVPPRRAGTQLEQDRVDHVPVIPPLPAAPGRREQRLDPRPRLISQFTSANHTTGLTQPRPAAQMIRRTGPSHRPELGRVHPISGMGTGVGRPQ